MFMAYTAGNIIGPFLFFPREAPEYEVSAPLATFLFHGSSELIIPIIERLFGNHHLFWDCNSNDDGSSCLPDNGESASRQAPGIQRIGATPTRR